MLVVGVGWWVVWRRGGMTASSSGGHTATPSHMVKTKFLKKSQKIVNGRAMYDEREKLFHLMHCIAL